MLVVEKLPGFNTQEVTRGLEAALAELKPGLTGIDIDTTIYRPASFIERATRHLSTGVVIACALTVLALGVLLGSWRAALIGATAIALSLFVAGLVLGFFGVGINMMVIAGLLLAIGVIVDDAIVDVENVMQRLRKRRGENGGRTARGIIIDAALEVRGPMLYATLIILLAVLPALFMHGRSAAFFQPLVLSCVVAVLASMATALVVTPALSCSAAVRRTAGQDPAVRPRRLAAALLRRRFRAHRALTASRLHARGRRAGGWRSGLDATGALDGSGLQRGRRARRMAGRARHLVA